jgi:hypothetical protein
MLAIHIAPQVVVEKRRTRRDPSSHTLESVRATRRAREEFGTTTIAPTAGRAWLAGFDVATDPVAARRASAVVFQEPGALVDRAVDTYSGGQRRRLEIARRETRDRHGGATDHRSARP